MKAEILNAGGSAPVQQLYNSNHSVHQYHNNLSTPSRPAAPISSGVSTAKAVEVVLEVLANKTGYETDMLEMDMDLETELELIPSNVSKSCLMYKHNWVLKHKM